MSEITITEALAEIKTIDARILKKRQFIGEHLVRQDRLRDPLEKDGGARVVIGREIQSIGDLQERKLGLRRAIQRANDATSVTVGVASRSIADWLVWRREVAPGQKELLQALWNTVQQARQQAQQKGLAVIATGDAGNTPNDVIVNLDEKKLAEQMEQLEEALGTLDGLLSLRNATVLVTL